MKDKIKYFNISVAERVLLWGFVILILFGFGLATNYTSQQIMNFQFNTTDSTTNVSTCLSDSTWMVSDTVQAGKTNDTLEFDSVYSTAYKFSISSDALISVYWINTTDSCQIVANSSQSWDFLNPAQRGKFIIRPTSNASYNMISQRRN